MSLPTNWKNRGRKAESTHLHHDPLSGHVFVFRNRKSDRVKLLYWDEDGFVIVYKKQV